MKKLDGLTTITVMAIFGLALLGLADVSNFDSVGRELMDQGYLDRLPTAGDGDIPHLLLERDLQIVAGLAGNRLALRQGVRVFACSVTEMSAELVDCARIRAED